MSRFREEPRYPLIEKNHQSLQAANGRPLETITLAAAAAQQIEAEDLQIDRQTLIQQAAIARTGGFPQLADNLERAAELTLVPNEKLLEMYEMLRPHRSTHADLMALAERLESEFSARVTAAMVRDAADVYRKRNLLRRAPSK